jgi:nicotinamide-nucleotide amidase
MSLPPDATSAAPPAADTNLPALVQQVAQALTAKGWLLSTAESCTGGLIAATCTDLAGSSAWFDRGAVTYSNEAKADLLGVPPELIAQHGAVSEPVARAMAEGMLQRSKAHLAVAVTGVAGPGGGTPEKPVGTVWLAWAWRDSPLDRPAAAQATLMRFPGDRHAVRVAAVHAALRHAISCIGPPSMA